MKECLLLNGTKNGELTPGINSDTEGILWVSLINDPANPYRYPDGNQITSNIVYGVIRNLGPWKALPYFTTNPIVGTPYLSRSQAIEKFNQNLYYSDGTSLPGNVDRIEEWINLQNQEIISYNNQNPTLNPRPLINIPPLDCLESANGGINFDLEFNISADCLAEYPFPFNGQILVPDLAQMSAQFTSWLSNLTSCYCDNNQIGGFGCKPTDDERFNGLTSIRVKDLNSFANETYSININLLNSLLTKGLDLNESFVKAGGKPFKNSLYLIGLGFSNNTYQPFIGEIG